MKNELSLNEKYLKICDLRPIDDVFFEAIASNKEVCEEILQTIMSDMNLTVTDSIVQSSIRNLYGRSVRLDAICTLGNGSKCNIEVQRSSHDNHLKRARFNASAITVRDSNTGDRFGDTLELYIVFISEFDFLKGGKSIYHVEKVLRETGEIIDDGLHEIFVNTAIDDGTDISDLMSCFIRKDFQNPKFPKFSSEVHRLKNTEGGVSTMCEIMDKYINIATEEQRKEIEQLNKIIAENKSLLSDTQAQLFDAKNQLSDAKNQLSDTKNQLSDAITELTDTRNKLSEAEKLINELTIKPQ